METHEASMVVEGAAERPRWLRVLVGIAAAIALAPVAGMVLAFAIVPALPIVLAIGYVLGPMNFLADLEDRRNEGIGAGRGASPPIDAHHAHHGAFAHA
jgi:hypothetical protein